MSKPLSPADELTLIEQSERALDRFGTAWRVASTGDNQTSLESFLNDLPEPARSTLLRFLAAIDQGHTELLSPLPLAGKGQGPDPDGTEQLSGVTMDFAGRGSTHSGQTLAPG